MSHLFLYSELENKRYSYCQGIFDSFCMVEGERRIID